MAKGRSLGSAQRGIAFSTISAFVVSVLILTVGAGYHSWDQRQDSFTITELGAFIQQFVGTGGVIVYSLGFVAAALSSMLTVPLGAAITVDSVFSDEAGAGKHSSSGVAEGSQGEEPQQLPRWVYLGIMFGTVIISVIVISANGMYIFKRIEFVIVDNFAMF